MNEKKNSTIQVNANPQQLVVATAVVTTTALVTTAVASVAARRLGDALHKFNNRQKKDEKK